MILFCNNFVLKKEHSFRNIYNSDFNKYFINEDLHVLCCYFFNSQLYIYIIIYIYIYVHIFEEHFQIQPVVRLLNPPRTVSKRRERLEEFELYWQMNLITYEPDGMNKQSEIEKTRAKMKNRRIRDTKRK